jgi:VanZ family protein
LSNNLNPKDKEYRLMNTLIAFVNHRFIRWGIALAWTLYLTILLLQPELQPILPTGLPPAPPSLEREIFYTSMHLLFFGITAVLWCFALEKDLSLVMVMLIAALFLVSFGFVTELAQGTVAGRTPQVSDMLANITGVCLGLALFRWGTRQNFRWMV